MMVWRPDVSATDGPIYRAICSRLAADVASGVLQPGERLPPQRELARLLGVDLTTVTRALTEAAAAGLVVSEGRRGTFVRVPPQQDDVEAASGGAASGMNMPPEPGDGSLRARFSEGMAAILTERNPPLHYQPAGGTLAQREAVAGFFSHLIPGTSADQCIVTAGSQHALYALLSMLTRPGDCVAVGCLAYPGLIAAARRLGIKLVPLAMDAGGIDPDALDAAARRHRLTALYVVPTNDNPTTATLPTSRRVAIAKLAREHGFTIIEDDAYGRLPLQPLPPIASHAPECTWHIATAAKLLSPSLRVGFVRAPTVRLALALAAEAQVTSGMAPPLNAMLVSRWLADGTFLRLLASIRAEAQVRMAEAASLLAAWQPRFHPEGYHLWLPLEDAGAADAIALRAVSAGLPAVAGSAFAVADPAGHAGLRISLGGSSSRARVRREIQRLDALLAQTVQSTII
jgi:DNA-binding transcriptional MocR family regulator